MTIGDAMSTRPSAADDAVRDLFTLRDAAEDVDEDRPHVRVVVDDLERAGHHVGVGAAADVEEVGGLAADLVDDVDGAHGETGAVGDDADVAVEPDVLQPLLVRGLLALVPHLRRVVLLVVGMAEHRVAVERDLRVERVHLARGLEDQRVDLDEVGVAVDVGAVQLQEDVDCAVVGLRVQLRGLDPRPGLLLGEPVDGVDPDLGDRVRVLLGDRFDLDTALRRQHAEVLLRGAVERERRVVLLGDVGGTLDPQDVDDVTLDVHPEDVRRVRAALVGVGRELDAAGLASPADLHLRLDDDRIADAVGGRDRVVDRS